jgi:hypothetical protein
MMAGKTLFERMSEAQRPSPSTVTDEELVELEAMNAIVGALATKAGMLFSERNARIAARAALEASGHTALLRDNAELREALTDIRNRVLCPVGPSPTLDDLGAIASAALERQKGE